MLRRYKLLFKIIFLTMTFNIAFSEVTVTIGNVSVDGYTEDIVVPITVSNPNESVGGFQFEWIFDRYCYYSQNVLFVYQ